MSDSSQLIRTTLDSLGSSGYRWTTDTYDQRSFGNRVMAVTNGEVTIRATLDRSIWVTELCAGDGRWYEWDVWRACMTGEPPSYDAADPAEQMLFVAGVGARISELIGRSPTDFTECLETTARSLRLIQKVRNWRRFEAEDAVS